MSGYSGGGSGGVSVGGPVVGGTNSTLLWVDSGGLIQSGATASPTATTTVNWGTPGTNFILGNSASWFNFNYSGNAANGVGSAAQPFLTIGPTGAGNIGMGQTTGAAWFISRGSATQSITFFDGGTSGIIISGGVPLGFAAAGALTAANPAGANGADTNIATRVAPGVWGPAAGSWMQNTSGEVAILAADYTNATTTFSSTLLSVTCVAGEKYNFDCYLYITESTAVDGWKLDFSGGSAGVTLLIANCFSTAETGIIVVLANATTAALATVLNATTTVTTGVQMIEIHGFFQPSGAGTFILRGAQNSHSAGTFTIKKGSSLTLRDTKTV